MEPYQKDLLERILKQSEESNKILHGLRRQARWGAFFGFLKWTIILGPVIWAYFYLQPYFGSIKQLYDTAIQQMRSIEGLQQQLKAVEGVQQQLKGVEGFLKNPPKIQQ
jgi:hypothetical protein